MAHSRRQRRVVLLRIHRWLGLGLGGVFALVSLTGSVLVFYLVLDRALNPALRVQSSIAQPLVWQQAVDTLRQAEPGRAGPWRIEAPLEPGLPVTARYYQPAEASGRHFAPLLVTLDTSARQVLATRLWGEFAMTWLYDLHYTLLLDKTGRTLVAILGIAFLIASGIGLMLWWPATGPWYKHLRVWPRDGRVRVTYDVHVIAGTHWAVVIMMLLVTGVYLAVPHWFKPVTEGLSPRPAMAGFRSEPVPGAPVVSADRALAAALEAFPGATPRWLDTPDGLTGSYRIRLWRPGEPSYRFPQTRVWVDAYSSRVLGMQDGLDATAGEVFEAWLHPLHNGEAFGMAGRIAVCLAGLVPPLLFATGWLRWRHKARARRGRAAKAGATPTMEER